ncbi:DegT/DnrJ/EryC1/StrS aminotransferase family protein [Cryomorpha ignava]|uniref:DegT/DnrJ/EryC1/StrS aminotransferase family protein n=1 Tax=Cryomorpha ignava TaxID=101383 RepID=A0A7K3WLN6_9FLAO|nr:DegT/DnrJ/EryC1/StrS family aminotransferase [Cryomorpha ignava]NEN22559.1 DegT/DnrJ/EryC1/StrS aminotransferase family protein [Cryomorpha ignava]
METENTYKNEIASFLGCDSNQLFLFWKGRVGLYTALKACGVRKGDEVIVQAFTCVVVPNSIIYTGAAPIYVDIERHSFNASFEDIEEKVTDKTKVIITQNTYGLSSSVKRISEYCAENGIICIEDCTHGFGGMHDGKSNGSYADFAFYSTQWNKPFSTGIGGILRVNNLKYLPEIQELERSAITPTTREKHMLNALIKARRYFLNDISYWLLLKLYRQLTAWKIVVGSSSPEEIEAPEIPEAFLKKGCNTQHREGIRSLKRLAVVLKRRKANALAISAFLKSHGKTYVSSDLQANHSFLIYPILVTNRAEFMNLAENAGLPMGDWFVSPLHPVTANFNLWGLNCEDFPVATKISSQIINIPLDRKSLKKYFGFLDANQHFIL